MPLRIKSSGFENNSSLPTEFTCQGSNINPALTFSDVPSRTKSLVLIMDDPDAATDPDGPGKTFDHWVLFNIPPGITKINENSEPAGATMGKNTAGSNKYTGPCPPNGTHRYFFKLYALDTALDLDKSAVKRDVEITMKSHILEQAELIGLYRKS